MWTYSWDGGTGEETCGLGWVALAAGTSNPASAIASVVAMPHLASKIRKIQPRRAWERFQASRRHASVRDGLEKRLGHPLPIDVSEAPCVLAEVERHKWIVAEQAGRDVWAEMDPGDPVRPALIDWFRKHFGDWYRARALRRGRPGSLLLV